MYSSEIESLIVKVRFTNDERVGERERRDLQHFFLLRFVFGLKKDPRLHLLSFFTFSFLQNLILDRPHLNCGTDHDGQDFRFYIER